LPIRRNCDGDENVTSSSDGHEEKHDSSRISTDVGRSIRFKFDEENADSPIRRNCDGDENVISSSDLHEEKHESSRI
jgi:hypothetical protein